MTQIWQQIRLGRHVGFEEGEFEITHVAILMSSLAAYRRSVGFQAIIVRGVGQGGASCFIAVVYNRNPINTVLVMHILMQFIYRLCMLTI